MYKRQDVARKVYATASGTLPNGKPVVVNADGTVSVAAETAASIGSEVAFEAGASTWLSATYVGSDKVVIVCADDGNSNQGTAAVGTISGTSISFGTAVIFNASTTDHVDVETVGNNQVLVSYQDGGDSTNGNSRVGTVSGTNISFGTEVTFETAGDTHRPSASYVSDGKAVLCFTADIGSGKIGKARIASISGTDVSFGTAVTFISNAAEYISTSYIGSDKFLVSYRNAASSDRGEAIVGTISGTNVSFGSAANFTSSSSIYISSASVGNNQVVIAYVGGSPYYGQSVVATISGTSVTFGTVVVFNSSSTTAQESTSVISRADGTAQISYVDVGGSPANHGKTISGTVSGTAIAFGTPLVFAAASTRDVSSAYIGNDKQVISFRDNANGGAGTAVVNQIGSTNLTAENYVGMSGGVVQITGTAGGTGSETVFEAATSRYVASAYDTNTNRVVIAYADNGNSSYGTAVVGTVSGFNISFGTPVVFETAEVQDVAITFDNNSNKIVIAYADEGNSSNGTAIVGTVSGTSISFGSAVVFDGNSDSISATFDSNSNKVVIAYSDLGNSDYGTSVVGTVSGTSISFGTPVVFASGNLVQVRIEFDSNSNKVVIAYKNSANSNYGTAIIGTVSGTGISFGTAVVFLQENARSVGLVIDSTNNKVIVAYADNGNSRIGTARVGTISGTGISFGTAVAFSSGEAEFYTSLVYNPTIQKVVIAYRDNTSNTLLGKYNVGTVSGTDISFTGEVVFNAGRSDNISLVYDPDSVTIINSFEDNANSSYGTSIVFTPSTLVTNRGEVASGSSASVDIIGTVSTNQDGLTPGQSYFVQTDGTLALTAGTPSVFAGTAISTTKLLVKT